MNDAGAQRMLDLLHRMDTKVRDAQPVRYCDHGMHEPCEVCCT